MTTNDSARGTEEIIVTEERKRVKFDPAQNEEISVKSGSIYSKKSEFQGYKNVNASPGMEQERGYTRVNNILKQLEDISEDGSSKFSSPDRRTPGYDTN